MANPAVLLDVDGTLVDSNYFHTLAWDRAFKGAGEAVETWRIHRAIGMGADQLLVELVGKESEDLEEAWTKHYADLIDEVAALPGAGDLVRTLKERGATTVLATSGKEEHVQKAQDVIGAERWVDDVVNSSEVEASKPAPDIFRLALSRAGAEADAAMVVGDTVWDVQAASACGLRTVALRCGGISTGELTEAGAAAVYDDPADLLASLDSSPLAELFA